jgi:MFS family permease
MSAQDGLTGVSTPSAPRVWPHPGWAWFAVAALMVAYTSSFIDRQILTLLVQPIRADLTISDTQFSLLAGIAFSLFYTVMGVPLARLADRGSRRWIIFWGIVVWSVMTVACGLANSFWALFAARIGVGIGEAALSPAAYSMISDYFPPRQRARALAVYSMAPYIGAGLALMIGVAVRER